MQMRGQTNLDPRYLIAVATYRRPMQLRRLLDSLEQSVDPNHVDVLVVDNDADASAKSIVYQHSLSPRYVVEPERGIASARNRALDEFGEQFTAIIYVDDDEWVEEGWFQTLIAYRGDVGADIVQGPVVTMLGDDAPNWVRAGRYFQRPIPPSGSDCTSVATNNVLLTREAWQRAGAPRFDSAFSSTGGSDFDFFWGIRKTGASARFCAEAVVFEDVPASRLSFTWLRRRYTRNGIVLVKSRRKHGEPLGRFLVVTSCAFVVGVAQSASALAAGRTPSAVPVERIFKGVGVFAGLFGYRIHEYGQAVLPRASEVS
jgi:glycosyltransferase involved in cell wall biosynthesis